jgi:F0F1-type ATP synthase delta subunit
MRINKNKNTEQQLSIAVSAFDNRKALENLLSYLKLTETDREYVISLWKDTQNVPINYAVKPWV